MVELEELLREIQNLASTPDNIEKEREVQDQLNEWLFHLETMWRQKSRELWLKGGDNNSKFFHASTICNRRRYSFQH